MAQARDLTQDLERHREVLEETVTKLRKSLNHWEQWYIEYSHLKEEVTSLPEQPPSRKDLARIRRDFDSDILTKKEINEIFGKNDLKEPQQIISVLSRRIDYVEKNVETLEKQLEAAENKLAASNVLANPDGVMDEESGLPITNIIEQIDEEGNVLDFQLQTGGDVGPKVLSALKEAGVDPFEKDSESKDAGFKDRLKDGSLGTDSKAKAVPETNRVNTTATAVKTLEEEPTKDGKTAGKRKGVSFAEDTKEGHEGGADEEIKSIAAKRLEAIMQQAKELEDMAVDSAVVPDDESEEDARLRREMLEYSASEIGPIVAELEIEENPTDDDDDSSFDYTEDEDEDEEDELGRSKHSVITEDYIKRMQELEKRLGVESAFAVDRRAPKREVPVEGLGRIAVRHPTNAEAPAPAIAATNGAKPDKSAKKGVRFAEELDIAEDATVLPERPALKTPEVNPVGDVIERSAKPPPNSAEGSTKKPSRFKKDRSAAAQPTAPSLPSGPLDAPVRFLDEDRTVAPSGPEGKTVADAVLERDVSSAPKDPDELDASLLHQEAAVEYHRMRNRMIQKQGGFAKEDELPIEPPDEEHGGPKRMSRFKAARLSRQ
jgi:unconventional prefoldin RPB5 interactor 1